MIHLENINKTYHNGAPLHVLKGINLDIERGEFVSIMGLQVRKVHFIEYFRHLGQLRFGRILFERCINQESE